MSDKENDYLSECQDSAVTVNIRMLERILRFVTKVLFSLLEGSSEMLSVT